jgi:hypothetical protein
MTELTKREDIVELRGKIKEAVEQSSKILIFDSEDVENAGHFIKNFGKLEKRIEEIRKMIVNPLNKEIKNINSFFKKLTEQFKPELERLKTESNQVLFEIRKKQEEERLKEQKELEEAILNEAEMFNDLSVIDEMPQVEFRKETLKTEDLTTVRIKKWRVIDFDKIDRKYLVINEELINQVRKDAGFEDKSGIEGIEFYYEETIRIK